MTRRRGVCTNLGRCKLAGAVQEADLEEFVCRECRHPLVVQEMGGEGASRFPVGVGIGVAFFALMAGLSFWIVQSGETPAPPVHALQASVAPAAPQPTLANQPAQPARVLLRFAGASTVGAQLAPALAEAYLASLGATGVQTSPAGSEGVKVQGTLDGAPQIVTVASRGSQSAFEALGSGAADIGMSSRRVTAEESQRLAALGSMTSPANEHVLGLDGIAVIVSKANPVAQLTREQLAAVFSGRATAWNAVGGRPTPIHLYAQGQGYGTASQFQLLVLGTGQISPAAKRVDGNQAVLDAVIADPDGIGFVALPWARGAKVLPVAEGDALPMVPTAFTLATEDYLLARRLYLYTAQAGANPHVPRFLEFALGPAGQAIVKRSGFVELTVKAEPPSLSRTAPPEYARLVAGSRRLSTSFRFVTGAAELDNRATDDLDRVVEYLRNNDLNGASVKLLGFADNSGAPAVNLALSRARARRVALAFAQRGVSGVAMAGFGAAMPVASNATQDGRERNRRVEIWISK